MGSDRFPGCAPIPAATDGVERSFLDLCVRQRALRFGRFTLKSGRISPYFFNAGSFASGRALRELGHCYAQAVAAAAVPFDMVFGPAYKGIPLVAAFAIAWAERFGEDIPYAYNRKERKAHGEGGVLVGTPLAGRVLVVDDVISAGTSAREAIDLIAGAGAIVAGLAIALDRCERGSGERTAVQEVEVSVSAPVVSIARLGDLIAYVDDRAIDDEAPEDGPLAERLRVYRGRYGA